MAFALKVTKGPGEGSEFSFEENEAKLGRTADNDIVVKDSGASRSHCRVFLKGARYFVEDLKSANGTKLNGSLLSIAKEIRPGDTITIGDVVFTFTLGNDTVMKAAPSRPETDEEPALESEDPSSTPLKPNRKSNAGVDAQREKGTTRRAPVVRHDTEGEIGTVPRGSPLQETNSTMEVEMQAPGKLSASSTDEPAEDEAEAAEPANANPTMEVKVPPPSALRRSAALAKVDDSTLPAKKAPPAKPDESTRELGLKKLPAKDEPEEMTAAERMRKRRSAQKSAAGRVSVGWSELPKAARFGFGFLGLLFVLGTGAFVVTQLLPKDTGPKAIEPNELIPNAGGTKDSFGAGEGVTWQRADMKVFNFTLTSPTQVVAVLHFSARDISKEEVSITVNGAEAGWVPPDTLDAMRDIELVLPPNIVKPREQNQLVFDNTRNPPANDPWRVLNIWVEIIPIPELSAEETARLAKDSIVNGDKLFESRSIGPENLFKAWKVYREAWLLMESLSDKSAVQDVYVYARGRMRELRPMLDQKCNGLLVEYHKAINARPPDLKRAMQLLKDVERYYPTREHPCYGFSKSLLSDMEAW